MSLNQKRKLIEDENNSIKRRNISQQNTETQISKLINSVLVEDIGNLVILVHDENENPYVTLQNAVSYTNMNLCVTKDTTKLGYFSLDINSKNYANGSFQNMQIAKKELAQMALEKLKETCFFIYKKRSFVNVTKENLQASSSKGEKSSCQPVTGEDSVAHKIMKKMGWTGGGLGAQEQGNLETVNLCENVNRQGFGTSNPMGEITKKLAEFSKSSRLLSLVFDSSFTKEERMLIHKAARKFNLKSKSSGTESRKLMVSRKITRMDIVKELLRVGGEDGLYKLHIPTKFQNMWQV